MACGIGACLSCVVTTTRRASSAPACDGPVFDAEEVVWDASEDPAATLRTQSTVDMSVEIGGLELRNPVMTASGTFASGREFADFVDLARLGAIVTKGVSLEPWAGNASPRIAETASGHAQLDRPAEPRRRGVLRSATSPGSPTQRRARSS